MELAAELCDLVLSEARRLDPQKAAKLTFFAHIVPNGLGRGRRNVKKYGCTRGLSCDILFISCSVSWAPMMRGIPQLKTV